MEAYETKEKKLLFASRGNESTEEFRKRIWSEIFNPSDKYYSIFGRRLDKEIADETNYLYAGICIKKLIQYGELGSNVFDKQVNVSTEFCSLNPDLKSMILRFIEEYEQGKIDFESYDNTKHFSLKDDKEGYKVISEVCGLLSRRKDLKELISQHDRRVAESEGIEKRLEEIKQFKEVKENEK